MITWRNGNIFPGEVIEIRLGKKSEKLESDASNRGDELEYYVHYIGFDRRLDEWISIDKIDLFTNITGGVEEASHVPRQKKSSKRKLEYASTDSKREDKEQLLAKLEKEHDEVTKVKNINSIVLGKFEIDTWYFSPYPDQYWGEERLFICEYCLKYMKRQKTLWTHMQECVSHCPPGRQIYRDNDLAMYEIDGKEHRIYCQNLCLLSKLFLDHKTLYYDVDPFLFYVMCEVDEEGSHIVGYFSKEKHSQENYNLACILTFPPYQRKGYGKFLISMSYELTKRENTTGHPEKPLSDLGKISYRSYWAFILLNFFRDHPDMKNLTLNDIARQTGIRTEDILSTLHALNFIRYWKGQHVIHISSSEIESLLKNAKPLRLCNPCCLDWVPPEKTSKKSS